MVPENILKSNDVSANLEAVTKKLRDENAQVRSLGYLIGLALIKKSSGHQQVDVGEQILSGLGVDELTCVDDMLQERLALEVCAESYHVKFHSS